MRTTKLYITLEKLLTMMLLTLIGGKYVGSGAVSEVRLFGINKIALKMGSCSKAPMSGKYIIKDGKLIRNSNYFVVSIGLGGSAVFNYNIWFTRSTHSRHGQTIRLFHGPICREIISS